MSNKPAPLKIAIVGAGLAGMSLALALQKQANFSGEVFLFEPRKNYEHDRHWSFWQVSEHLFSELRPVQFNDVDILYKKYTVKLKSKRYPYSVLRSDAVYGAAIEKINSDPRFHLQLGTTVAQVLAGEVAPLKLHFSEQAPAYFDLVFDSRYFPEQHPKGFQQWFIGAEIAVPDTDSKISVRLMDFCLKHHSPIGFFYTLPLNANTALVQLTYFLAPNEQAPADAQQIWREYVANTLGLNPEDVIRHERGCIPMARIQSRYDQAGHHAIGTAAGWVRASTGYGFLDIQKAAVAMAQAICIGDMQVREKKLRQINARTRIDESFDAIFLDVLAREPENAAHFFYQLFDNTQSERLIRFLSGQSTSADRLAIMQALPALPFIKSLPAGIRS
jgi:lycopene beta-cyclase